MVDYDVYYLWLGISPQERPPNFYRLLGVPLFEQNTEVIRNAADRQLSHVKRLAVNQFTQIGQKLLDEIATAKLCLLKPEKRAAYDAELRDKIHQRPGGKTVAQIPVIPALRPEPRPASSAKNAVIDVLPGLAELTMIVGSNPMCDFVIDLPVVSAVHAQVTRCEDRTFIRDLKSTNGTYVNWQRIDRFVEITPRDWITLGRDARFQPDATLFPVSQRSMRVVFAGRHSACELRREDESVSMVHARIVISDAGLSIEDLGSTNGTSVVYEDGGSVKLPPFAPTLVSGCATLMLGHTLVDLAELCDA